MLFQTLPFPYSPAQQTRALLKTYGTNLAPARNEPTDIGRHFSRGFPSLLTSTTAVSDIHGKQTIGKPFYVTLPPCGKTKILFAINQRNKILLVFSNLKYQHHPNSTSVGENALRSPLLFSQAHVLLYKVTGCRAEASLIFCDIRMKSAQFRRI